MGFVLLGAFAANALAWQGVIIQMLAHGISTGALFVMAGALQERFHTRDLERLGGLWGCMPRFAGVSLFFALASLGLPGLGNFIGEFLVLLGAFAASPTVAVLAAVGLVLATVYSLWLVQKIFHGELRTGKMSSPADLSAREATVFAALVAAIVWLGIYPSPFLRTAGPSLDALRPNTAPSIVKLVVQTPP